MIQERWQRWTHSERLIVSGVAGFALLVGLIFGIISPVQSAKEDALSARDRAQQDLILVENGLANLQARSGSSTGVAPDIDRFRLQVTQAAQSRGLSIVRLQNVGQGSVELMFSDASPTSLYHWLDDISGFPGSKVLSGNLRGREGGIEAEIELQGTQQ